MERVVFPDGIKVYNFTVDGNHNYFVIAQTDEFGQTCVLVHNTDCHGNSKNSDRIATLYGRYDEHHNLQKWGISQNPDKRYTRPQLGTDELKPMATGSRSEMLKMERDLVETNPGPMNHEPWAGARVPGTISPSH
jgi:hypothetical protein